MNNLGNTNRCFVFLQGPHGPFFAQLAKMLRRTGARTIRVGFNKGDQVFWSPHSDYIGFHGRPETWADTFGDLIQTNDVTDLVLYGDTRDIHAQAIAIAKNHGLTVHVFEEGYLRPYWVTYERNGANGHSRLMDMSVHEMQEALKHSDLEMPMPPSHWGDTRHHVFYGALYHWFVMFANRRYPHFKPHRNITITQEFQLYLKRLIMMPIHRVHRLFTTARITQGGFPYHLVLLQLEHDAAFQNHSPFQSMREFLEITVENFANHAPRHHQLVFKAHPLEDGRAAIQKTLKTLAQKFAIEDRIHYVRGGKLARLLDEARSAITVNSTAGQQVLWRGIPLKTFGDAVYAKPEFVSDLSQVDAVHTLTSLTGFEALIRGLAVTTYGLPFYAGWGLTTDRLRAPDRRKTSIDLATLVHRALIDYPRYFDPLTKTAAPIEVILDRLAQDQIPSAGPFNRGLSKLQGLFASAHPFWR